MLKCGIIGFGGLGKVHFGNLLKMEKSGAGVRVAALCDVERESFSASTSMNIGESGGVADLSPYRLYSDAADMLDKEELDFAVAAVPTYLHSGIAVSALNRGLHVFSEKPMALTLEQCQAMLDASAASGKLLMIGQCLRYWPEYRKLKELVDGGEYGKVVRADFSRLSATPLWSWQNWYMDHEKSGGAAMDLHVHDVDTINWLFGVPEAVTSVATHVVSKFDSISTAYHYADKAVSAVADWGLAAKYPFGMGFVVRFEKAVATMSPQGFRIYTQDEALAPELPKDDAYYCEMADFTRCIREGAAIEANPPESSMRTLKITLAEKESALSGKRVAIS
jgi:predicted dehydrogenase